jgi:starch synthase
MTPEFGCGLENILAARKDQVSGILNGLDIESWDPSTDLALPSQYAWNTLDLRQINKTALLQEFNLAPASDDLPLIVVISRFFHQKGVDLVVEALRKVIDQPWQAILLGTGDPELEQACRQLETDFPDRVRAAIKFDLALSQRMYGGADMLLMPSRYEPCGLSQMIAMRYGCIPVARATGGLKDTIKDSPGDEQQNTGFLFEKATGKECTKALKRALKIFKKKDLWQQMQINGMHQDFSWTRSAMQYASIYQSLRKDVS